VHTDASVVDGAKADSASPTDSSAPTDSATPNDDAATPDSATPDSATPDSATPDSSTPADAGDHACSAPSDCRLFSFPCNGCHCLPLNTSDSNPVCPTPPESCFIDPCEGKLPTCSNGHCAIQ
jgi:hypothetical protein